MASSVDKEVLGDWSGIKGTEYHILYVIWLLLRVGSSRVSFYEGNDLLAVSIPPPRPLTGNTATPPIALHAKTGNEDVWIQLKSTDANWTLARFLPKETSDPQTQENLLKNFICNAFVSNQQAHPWEVRLVSQGFVKTNEIEAFIANPKEPYLTRLKEVLKRAKAHIESSTTFGPVDEQSLRDLAFDVLKQLALSKPKSFDALKSEIESEIAYSCFNRELVQQIANSLRGAILEDAAAGPSVSRSYDLKWLNDKAGRPIKSVAVFDINPVAACDEAVERALPARWKQEHFVRRERFENAIENFLNTRETLFVLVGSTGKGKSWVSADLAVRILRDRMRLLTQGFFFHNTPNLKSLVANQIRPLTSSADWSDEHLFKRTLAASEVSGRGPFVIILDDIVIAPQTVDVFIHHLATLVSDCKNNGIKLVVTCQQQIWDLYQLADSMPANELFLPEKDLSSSHDSQLPQPTYSFLLGDLTPDEVTQIVSRRLPKHGEESAALLLRAGPFSVLRNAYLLEQYLDQHADSLGKGQKPAPVDVNDLLEMRISKALKTTAQAMGLSDQDLKPAFDSLVNALWPQRLEGLTYPEVVDILKPIIGDQTSNFLAGLRKTGFLTTVGKLKIAEDRIADRIYARLLADDNDSDEEGLVNTLRPETDTGVVAALMRGIVSNPIRLAEKLLNQDTRWMKGIAEGLAQSSAGDYRAVALLAGLLRSNSKHWILSDVGDAFAQLASRDVKAWKAAAEMYFSDHAVERNCGEYILASAMEFIPQKVTSAARLKLSRASRIRGISSSDQKQRGRLIQNALDPLRGINHRAAAEFGERILNRYGRLINRINEESKYRVFEDVDRARGRIALHRRESEPNALLIELESDDHITRYRAACALRGVAFERPDLVKDGLCKALTRDEETAATINRLLLASYPLIAADPELLLRTLAAGSLTNWNVPTLSAGQVLGLLADLAAKYPEEVYRLLPKELKAFHGEWQAFLSEMHAYAWWRCAEQIDEAASQLASLTKPKLENVPEEFIPFAFRGAATAQLACMCVGNISAESLAGNQIFYPLWDLQFAYLNTRDFIDRRKQFLLDHADYKNLEGNLVKCVVEEERVKVHPIYEQLCQSQSRCAMVSVETLTQFASVLPDSLEVLRQVPRDWQALQMCRELLEEGHNEPTLVDFTVQLCEERSHGANSFQAPYERDHCLAILGVRKDNPHKALQEYNEDAGRSLFNATAKAEGLAHFSDSHPTELLSLLDQSLAESDDLPTLYYWHPEARTWPAWLLSRVYARMFDPRPVSVREAKQLCRQVETSIREIPESADKAEYLQVYRWINQWLDGGIAAPDDVKIRTGSLIQTAHSSSISLLRKASQSIDAADSSWLDEELSDPMGWIESSYQFQGGSHTRLFSAPYRNYAFPSFRLASVAIGRLYRIQDPAARILRERKLTKDLVSQFDDIFRQASPGQEETEHYKGRLEKASLAFEKQLAITPLDEYLRMMFGDILLRQRRLSEAESTLKECLGLRGCSTSTRASVLYSLACVYARLAKESECRQALEESAKLQALNIEHTAKDDDLLNVRNTAWFRDLIGMAS